MNDDDDDSTDNDEFDDDDDSDIDGNLMMFVFSRFSDTCTFTFQLSGTITLTFQFSDFLHSTLLRQLLTKCRITVE